MVIPYVILGTLYMHYRVHATGLDVIPHREFWGSIPGNAALHCSDFDC